MSVIEVNNISKIYGFGDATTYALEDVSLKIEKGEFVAIMGHSGSGKSTLMNILGILDKPSHGTYLLGGKNVSKLTPKQKAIARREKIGFIFQSFNLLPKMNAVENVALPLLYKGLPHVKRLKKAEEMMDKVGLKDKQYYQPNQLSGGQVQRVAVARALINRPALVLADEPTGNLDTDGSHKVVKLLSDIHNGGNTIVMVTHNPDLTRYCDRIIHMKDGKIKSDEKQKPEKRKKKKGNKS